MSCLIIRKILDDFQDPINMVPISLSPYLSIHEISGNFSVILEVPEIFLKDFLSVKYFVEESFKNNSICAFVLLSNKVNYVFSSPKKVIVVASSKGGVGKSTFSVQLALSLSLFDFNVGLLDSDIYGLSISSIMNISKVFSVKGKLIPLSKFGIYIMSLGFFVDEMSPLVWRGPILQKAIRQLFLDVSWPPLDVLIVDTPPGTGDVQLGILQIVKVSGVILVVTPQRLSVVGAIKSLNVFLKFDVPVLGFIENMSYFSCSFCERRNFIFSLEESINSVHYNIFCLGKLPINYFMGSLLLKSSCFLNLQLLFLMRDLSFKILNGLKFFFV